MISSVQGLVTTAADHQELFAMADRVCRWGILGTAEIARKNWQAIRNSGNGTLVAVASRRRERAEQYIRECQSRVPFEPPPRACEYEELLASDDVDAVYLPLPTAVRREWVIRAASAGKHVVCEKPCGINSAEVAEILSICDKRIVQFMDGVMFLHSGRFSRIRACLDDKVSVGEVRRITSQFSFYGGDEFLQKNIRVNGRLEPLGCLGDLGWYNIRFTLWVLGYQMPERVSGRMLSSVDVEGQSIKVPTEFAGEMFFANGVSASFYCSFRTELQQWADVSGQKGRIHVSDFVLPYSGSELLFEVFNDQYQIDGCQFTMEKHARRESVSELSNNAPSAQESNLFRDFAAIVLSGKTDRSWGAHALKTQQVLDACLKSARSNGQIVAMQN